MNARDDRDRVSADTECKNVALDRRRMLLGGTALVAASALGSY